MSTDGESMYDNHCKQILAHRLILAWIMKECTSEYHNVDLEDIAINYIDGDPLISPNDDTPDESIRNLAIYGVGTEDHGDGNRANRFDIRYRATFPSEDGLIGLIINIEAQNNFNPGYPLVKRGIFYACSTVASQYGKIFSKSEYAKIIKVYSIWICPYVPKKRQNSITRYSIQEMNLIDNVREKKEHYDLISVVMVCLGEANTEPYSNILKMLNTLLSQEVSAADKIAFLEKEFNIPITEELEREVHNMCNLSQVIKRKGIEEGRSLGRQEGILEGRQEGLTAAIMNCMKNLKLSVEEALKVVGISESEREYYTVAIMKQMN